MPQAQLAQRSHLRRNPPLLLPSVVLGDVMANNSGYVWLASFLLVSQGKCHFGMQPLKADIMLL